VRHGSGSIDLLDDELVPLNADLDQNNDPEVAQRGRNLDA
jgi:hypothetical protein